MKTVNVGRIRLKGSLAETISPADPEIFLLFEVGVKSFVKECPEFGLRSLGENLPWITVDPNSGNFAASILVADSFKRKVSAYQDEMQRALPSFKVSEFSYEPHLITTLEEDELVHRREEVVDYLKQKGRTGSFQIAHGLQIDRETCNSLLAHLLRAGKLGEEGEDWNNAVFFVP